MRKYIISFLGVLSLLYSPDQSPSFINLEYSHIVMIQDYLDDIKNWAKLSQASRNTLREEFVKEIKQVSLIRKELKTAKTEAYFDLDSFQSFNASFPLPGLTGDIKFFWRVEAEDNRMAENLDIDILEEAIERLNLIDPNTRNRYDGADLLNSCAHDQHDSVRFQVFLKDIFKCLDLPASTFDIVFERGKNGIPAEGVWHCRIQLSAISFEESFDNPGLFFWSMTKFTEDAMAELDQHFASPDFPGKKEETVNKLIKICDDKVVGIDKYTLDIHNI